MLSIIFLLFSKILCFEIIRLNFEQNTTLPKSKEPNDIMNYLQYNNIYTEFIVGTPEKKVKARIFFDCYNLALPGENSIGDIQKLSESSSTLKFNSKETSKFFSTFFKSGKKAKETFKLNSLNNGRIKYDSINFIYTNELKEDYPGVLGLHIHEDSFADNLKEYNFIKTLKSLDIIESYFFTVKYNGKNKGEILIGNPPDKYDKRYKKEKFVYSKARSPLFGDDWGFNFDNIYLGDENLIQKYEHGGVYFKLEYGVIHCPLDYQYYFNIIFKNYIDKGICFYVSKNNFTSYYYCKESIKKGFPTLTFELKSLKYNFTFTFDDLFEKVNGNYYFMVVFRKSENTWKLGKQFFQKYQLVFNQDAKQIGVYTEIESSFEIARFLIVIVSIIIVILGFIIFTKYRKIPKIKKAKELTEEDFHFDSEKNAQKLLG